MKEPYSKCYFYALDYIYRYPKTEQELKIKLLQKWYLERDVDNTIEYLHWKWYVDDEKFTESYINWEAINKGKPIFRVKKKLMEKWISKDIINKVCREYEEEIYQGNARKIEKEIENYKRKWIQGFDIIQKLMAKWYNLSDIKKVIKDNAE